MPRETLSREQIVRAAVSVLDAEGVEGLNMRRLGTELGVAATATHWHVKSKDELVAATPSFHRGSRRRWSSASRLRRWGRPW